MTLGLSDIVFTYNVHRLVNLSYSQYVNFLLIVGNQVYFYSQKGGFEICKELLNGTIWYLRTLVHWNRVRRTTEGCYKDGYECNLVKTAIEVLDLSSWNKEMYEEDLDEEKEIVKVLQRIGWQLDIDSTRKKIKMKIKNGWVNFTWTILPTGTSS